MHFGATLAITLIAAVVFVALRSYGLSSGWALFGYGVTAAGLLSGHFALRHRRSPLDLSRPLQLFSRRSGALTFRSNRG